MKKIIVMIGLLISLSFNVLIIPCMAETRITKNGVYTLDYLKLSPDKNYTVNNNSFNERTFLFVFDSNLNIVQTVRLWPQSRSFKLVPLKDGYKIAVTGEGELIIS
ncbi:hypothetical protein psyc5s11_27730 [Clostridium gelidum]|uniref:Uncharacterized protein n=1 Tax=Clostridium gelidum TaxID=704125 RepID=A0ABM7T439_9CLOT|nr:hypothetical protein [Clostridium gelidum]BCZ46706.1 hypothetical protein psyc5s11_27730 [Clostridium gelidum]